MSTDTVVFIAGMSRSGSTLLERLLGQIPGWWVLGEVVHLWERGVLANESCGCGESFQRCEVWAEIGETAFGGWEADDARQALTLARSVARDRFTPHLISATRWRGFQRRLDDYNAMLSGIFAATRKVTGASVLVDSSKHTSVALALRQNPTERLRVVHLVRDSRGVAHSLSKVTERPAAGSQTMMHRWSPLETSIRYVAYNTLLSATFRAARFPLRYEDLVRAPEVLVSAVCAWATPGGCPHETHLDVPPRLPLTHGISGNPMRSLSGPLELTEDREWASVMSRPTRLLVTALTLPTLLQSRYPLGGAQAGRPS